MHDFAGALNQALCDALSADDSVVVFRVTDGLAAAFGSHRCFDTPLCESGIVGSAVGMAMNGLRPVIEIQFDAFAYSAFEQITSHVAKMRNRTAGRLALPMVIRIPYGGGIGAVEHHSDSSEAYYTHTPGLLVVTPSTVADAYSLLREAIDHPDPVIFLEPKRLYWRKEDVALPQRTGGFGQAAVRRSGTTATLVAYGPTVDVALEAAEEGQAYGWELEVVDLRTLVPLDDKTLVRSIRRTGRAVVLHEAAGFGGYGAEIAARLTESCFYHLEAPIRRVTGLDAPYPAPSLEQHYLPRTPRVLAAVEDVLSYA
ncbi:alpha-ketoacid dehydrogenase subunit beta [Streptomyces sp. IMTB 2501]|uniref:alpha-ketoacid dehydrogenase subunit beta n=1 Tax=Streptomyces sp. IMTB 2501 TaxID=1776340 RepID=UPI0009700EFA|nr:alpha-ketoacid dehydrogenase subunit beta [Streptomyces sp. IMTB 2501]OLZ74562.1 alpha-ketoacid dehydrogenase subunit beta [Streptomyces sp. IMTB 2501]